MICPGNLFNLLTCTIVKKSFMIEVPWIILTKIILIIIHMLHVNRNLFCNLLLLTN